MHPMIALQRAYRQRELTYSVISQPSLREKVRGWKKQEKAAKRAEAGRTSGQRSDRMRLDQRDLQAYRDSVKEKE